MPSFTHAHTSQFDEDLAGSDVLASRHTFMFIQVRLLLICIIAEQ